jgi:hypothetical protein
VYIAGISVFEVSPPLAGLRIPPPFRSDVGFERSGGVGWSSRRGIARFAQTVEVSLLSGCLSPPDSFRFTACPGIMSSFGGVEFCLGCLTLSHGLKRVCRLGGVVTCGRCFACAQGCGCDSCLGGSSLERRRGDGLGDRMALYWVSQMHFIVG